jgi:hypothetical protein
LCSGREQVILMFISKFAAHSLLFNLSQFDCHEEENIFMEQFLLEKLIFPQLIKSFLRFMRFEVSLVFITAFRWTVF